MTHENRETHETPAPQNPAARANGDQGRRARSASATIARDDLPAAGPRECGPVYTPNVDVCDCGTEVRIVADVPGCRAEAVDVSFDEGVLTIAAAVQPRTLPGTPVHREYGVGDYRRSFRLGEGFDASQISADLARGVLTVRVPRLAAVRPRKIEVRAG